MIMVAETQYLPPIEYFVRILKNDRLLLEACENYQKQSYRNRCYILNSNKVQELSVPIKKTSNKIFIRDVEIDYSQKWLQVHWRSIKSAYGKAPFFEYYGSYFEEVLFKRHKYLFDLNLELLKICLKFLQLEREIGQTEDFLVTSEVDSGINDMRNLVHPKNKSSNMIFKKYNQVFSEEFVENLSIIDLLFCEGPNAVQFLKGSLPNQSEQML